MFSLITIAATTLLFSCSKEGTNQRQLQASGTENVFAKANLVAWYTFDGDTKDHSGNGNDADFNSADTNCRKKRNC